MHRHRIMKSFMFGILFPIIVTIIYVVTTSTTTTTSIASKSYHPLHDAVNSGAISNVYTVLQQQNSSMIINSFDSTLQTPLLIAVQRKYVEIATLLLRFGASPIISNHLGVTPLHLAASNGLFDLLFMLLEKCIQSPKAVINYVNKSTYHISTGNENTMFGHSESLDDICTNVRDSRGNTPLHAAVGSFDFSILPVDDINHNLSTPMITTGYSLSDVEETVKILLDRGASMHSNDSFFKRTPCLLALSRGLENILPCGTSHIEISALITAATAGDDRTLEFLLKSNYRDDVQTLNINSKDNSGRTALHLAAAVGHVPSILLLLKHGADRLSEDRFGEIPLHKAVFWGRSGAVIALLSNIKVLEHSSIEYLKEKMMLNSKETNTLNQNDIYLRKRSLHGLTPYDIAKRKLEQTRSKLKDFESIQQRRIVMEIIATLQYSSIL